MAFAAKRFAEQGYHPTSVSEIVSGLGVGKGVFYWYFDSKEQLFLEILREAQTDLRRRQQQAIADEPDPIRRIELGLRASLAWSEAHRDHNKLIQFAATEATFTGALRRGPGHRRGRRGEARQGGHRRGPHPRRRPGHPRPRHGGRGRAPHPHVHLRAGRAGRHRGRCRRHLLPRGHPGRPAPEPA